jgi:alpha-D-ribose 1-methylphosphonate 5-triphosphate synthase subunit PhnL
LKCIYRTYTPTHGTIQYSSARYGMIDLAQATDRQMIFIRKYEIGYVSQFLNVMPRTSAWKLVKLAGLDMGGTEDQAESEATRILTHFELKRELWERYPNTFSGGEKLRLNIAMAMVKRPRLLLLDEPTASLDANSKERVKELLTQVKQEGATMLGIFHDLEFMEQLCDREYKISAGSILNN